MRARNARSGFTVVETVVASMLLIVVLAGAYLVVTACINLVQLTRDYFVATTISSMRLEHARATPFASLSFLSESQTLVDDYGLPTNLGGFRRTTTIYTNQPSAGCTQITVQTDIINHRTRVFSTGQTFSGLYADYALPPNH